MTGSREFILIASLLASRAAIGQQIDVRQLENGELELRLTADTILDEPTAQLLLRPRAIEACAGLTPVLGRYRFEGRTPTDPGADGAQETRYRFTQQVSCGPVEATPVAETETGVRQVDAVQRLEDFIRAISLQFIESRSVGDLEAAYAALSREMKAFSTFDEWSTRATEFNAASGPIRSATVWRVTVYDNPAGAPEPGTYIAADYEVEYEKVAFQCGYLMWFERSDNLYVVTREESGSIPLDVFEATPESQLPALRAQLGCLR